LVKVYFRGNMIRFVVQYTDSAGASQAPSNPKFYLFDPQGTQKLSGTPSSASGTGRYVYNLVTASNWELGNYRAEFFGESSEGTIRNSVFFELEVGDART
jgi:hypothetical protein